MHVRSTVRDEGDHDRAEDRRQHHGGEHGEPEHVGPLDGEDEIAHDHDSTRVSTNAMSNTEPTPTMSA
jgi:hypothetical protein